jgi:hypothetical protein
MNSTETDIIIRVPQSLYDERIQEFIDYVEYKKIVSKSQATEEDIDNLLSEIKEERREKVKQWLKEKNIHFNE